jgi:hypothetical protein
VSNLSYHIAITSQFGAKEKQMEYKVISDIKVCGKVKDEKLTKDDIISAGGNVEHLLAAGHIVSANSVKATPAAKEVPAVQQEEEFPVFNSVNNEQGEI